MYKICHDPYASQVDADFRHRAADIWVKMYNHSFKPISRKILPGYAILSIYAIAPALAKSYVSLFGKPRIVEEIYYPHPPHCQTFGGKAQMCSLPVVPSGKKLVRKKGILRRWG